LRQIDPVSKARSRIENAIWLKFDEDDFCASRTTIEGLLLDLTGAYGNRAELLLRECVRTVGRE